MKRELEGKARGAHGLWRCGCPSDDGIHRGDFLPDQPAIGGVASCSNDAARTFGIPPSRNIRSHDRASA